MVSFSSYKILQVLDFRIYYQSITLNKIYCFSQNNTINDKQLITSTVDKSFSFLLAGHIYGSPGKSQFPSSSFVANIDNFDVAKLLVSIFMTFPWLL